jgi:hypothetical protein
MFFGEAAGSRADLSATHIGSRLSGSRLRKKRSPTFLGFMEKKVTSGDEESQGHHGVPLDKVLGRISSCERVLLVCWSTTVQLTRFSCNTVLHNDKSDHS